MPSQYFPSLIFTLFLSLALLPCILASSCSSRTSGPATLSYGPCDNVCIRRSPVFAADCEELADKGCVYAPCPAFPAGSEVYGCQLNTSQVSSSALCPGDSMTFDGVNVQTLAPQALTLSVDLSGAKPTLTDVYILADTTGSMRTALLAARAEASRLFSVFGGSGVSFGVGEYKDEHDNENGFVNGFRHLQGLTPNRSAAAAAMDRWSASGGGDDDEGLLPALYSLTQTTSKFGWRPEARKYVVVIGDHPGHEPSCALDGIALTRRNTVAALRDAGVTVLVVDFRRMDSREPNAFPSRCAGYRRAPDGDGQASALATGTGGSIVQDNDQNKVVDLIAQAVVTAPKVYDVTSNTCSIYIFPQYEPPLPLRTSGASVTLRNKMTIIPPTACGTRTQSFTCSYQITEGGVPVGGAVTVSFTNVQGC